MNVMSLLVILCTLATIYFTYADYKAQKAAKEHFNKIAVIGAIVLGFEIYLLWNK